MTKPIDPDIKGLQTCVQGMETTTKRMRRPTLEYLWDRYVVHSGEPEDAPAKEEVVERHLTCANENCDWTSIRKGESPLDTWSDPIYSHCPKCKGVLFMHVT